MAFAKAQASGQAPLILGMRGGKYIKIGSLYIGVDASAMVKEVFASGENATGSASRPTLHVPETVGAPSGSSIAYDLGVLGRSPRSSAYATWAINPSLPTVNTGTFNLPLSFTWRFPDRLGPIVSNLGQFVLYAEGSGGHTWSGSLMWEEL